MTEPGAPAAAETATPAGNAHLEELVVTARKRVENNQDAPATIVAVAGAEIAERGITDPQGLEKFLPSANLRRQGPVTQVFIRGVGTRTDSPNFAAASAFVYNGIIVQRYGTFGLVFDLESVQSIAGPQGTLYGGSAAGGAINLFSSRPTGDNSGLALLESGNLDAVHASVIQNVELSDTLSLRGAVDYNSRDAYYSAGLFRPDDLSGRLALLARPTDNITAHIFYSHGSARGRPSVTVFTKPKLFPDDPYRAPPTGVNGNPILGSNTYQKNKNDLLGANIDFTWGENTFTYIPAYVAFTADYLQYSGNLGNQLRVYDRERQHSQELRWNRDVGPVQLSAGVFYLHDDVYFFYHSHRYTSPTAFTQTLLNRTYQVNESYAVYQQAIWSLTDAFRVTAGARLSRDSIEAKGTGGNGVGIDFVHEHTHPDYKLGIDFDVTPQVMAYANLQTGYIPFGYNPDVAPNTIVQESKLFAVSGGLKSRLFDNRLELNVEGFHYRYEDFQAIQFVPVVGLSTVLNADKSTIYGVDLSLRAQFTADTQANASVVLQRGRFNRFEGLGYDYSDNTMVYTPEVSLQAGLQHSIDLGDWARLVGRIDTRYRSSAYGSFQNFPNTELGAFTKTDVTLTYQPASERWSLQAFVRNLEDSAAYTTLSANAGNAPGTGGIEAPRTYGLRLTMNWN